MRRKLTLSEVVLDDIALACFQPFTHLEMLAVGPISRVLIRVLLSKINELCQAIHKLSSHLRGYLDPHLSVGILGGGLAQILRVVVGNVDLR